MMPPLTHQAAWCVRGEEGPRVQIWDRQATSCDTSKSLLSSVKWRNGPKVSGGAARNEPSTFAELNAQRMPTTLDD